MTRVVLAFAVAGALGAGLWLASVLWLPKRTAREVARFVSAATQAPPGDSGHPTLRWIAAGGGETPDLGQVQLEQDLALAARVFGPGGRLRFAGGPGVQAVQVLDPSLRPDPIVAELGNLFDPRLGRDARYRATELAVDGAATTDDVLRDLREAVRERGAPVVIYLAAHGSRGETPREAVIGLWGGRPLAVTDLARALDESPGARAVQLVVTSCFSGGFAELAFAGAEEAKGAAPTERCGFFASLWDEPSSGCDSNPDRRSQEGYGIHFLHALRGEDRDGRALARSELDFDHDGRISLLEAHSRVRIVATSSDVPTTTSERWLRVAASQKKGAGLPVLLPEEEAVIERLTARLGLGSSERAREHLQRVRDALVAAQGALDDARDAQDDAYVAAAAEVLGRWPVLNDPWHPLFSATLRDNRDAIARLFASSETIERFRRTEHAVDTKSAQLEALRLKKAPLERLVRALDTRVLAGRLRRQGGREWATYQALLACERQGPPI